MSETIQQPSVGRIVHYVLPESSPRKGEHRPAIITQVWQRLEHESAPGMSNMTCFRGQRDDFIDLVSAPGMPQLLYSVHYCPNGTPGTWHWPERV